MIKIIELFGGYRVVVHNEREDLLARVVESRLEDTVRYKKEILVIPSYIFPRLYFSSPTN